MAANHIKEIKRESACGFVYLPSLLLIILQIFLKSYAIQFICDKIRDILALKNKIQINHTLWYSSCSNENKIFYKSELLGVQPNLYVAPIFSLRSRFIDLRIPMPWGYVVGRWYGNRKCDR
ncbi:hypothetical protein DOY81_009483 [Sarcophaga bullata]|nr:hypothetical protein DOY81_009483 [Sarcophaga bullata]